MPDGSPTGSTDAITLSDFLHDLFNGLEGYAYAPTLDRETGDFRPVFCRVPHSIGRLEQHIRESSETTEVYLSPSVFSESRVSKSNFVGSNFVWSEFDGPAIQGSGIAGQDIEPSIRIRSSTNDHVHCYWRLDEPVIDSKTLEDINRALAYTLGADKSGWDCTQILRPPETRNHKRGLPVAVVGYDQHRRYNIGDFSSLKAPDRIEDDSIHLGTIPDVTDVIYEYALGLEFKDVFTSSPREGDRSTYYMRVGYMAAEAGATNEELYALLRNCDDRWKKYADRSDRHRRLLDIIERVRIKHPLPTGEEEVESEDIEIYDVISFGNQIIEVEWLLPGLLQQNGSMLLTGPSGVGKTQLALNFCYGLATGQPVLDYAPESPKRVLFISAEMPAPDLKVFTDQITKMYGEEYHELLRSNMLILPLGESFYLNQTAYQDRLRRMVDALDLDGVVFDSLGSATSKSLSDEEQTKALFDFTERFRNDMGVFTWFIHHQRKATENNKEPSQLEDVYGSMYITARSTSVLSLWPISNSVLKVRELKVRLAPKKEPWFIKRESGLTFSRTTADEAATVLSYKPPKSEIGKAVKSDDKRTNRGNPYGI